MRRERIRTGGGHGAALLSRSILKEGENEPGDDAWHNRRRYLLYYQEWRYGTPRISAEAGSYSPGVTG
jgi:hypothetical protein